MVGVVVVALAVRARVHQRAEEDAAEPGRHQLRRRAVRVGALPADRPARVEPVLQRLLRPAVPVPVRPAELHHLADRRASGATQSPDSIVAPTSDRVRSTYQVAVYFKLNTKLLRQFHEQLGLQYAAYTAEGLVQPHPRHVPAADRERAPGGDPPDHRRRHLRQRRSSSSSCRTGCRRRSRSSSRTRSARGSSARPPSCAPASCGDPTFIIKAVSIPKSVGLAFQQQRTSAILVTVKENEVQQAEAEAQSKNALGLNGDQYVLWKAVNAGKTQFWIVPSSGGRHDRARRRWCVAVGSRDADDHDDDAEEVTGTPRRRRGLRARSHSRVGLVALVLTAFVGPGGRAHAARRRLGRRVLADVRAGRAACS